MEKNLDTVRQVLAQVNQVILGKREEIREVILAFLANGHVLLEDIPGVGKTTLALAFSRTMLLDYKRIQFTPDVLPSDLTGFSIYRREEEKFVYQPGSVFCNLLLADEINRTSPKTQSALLEVMEERKVTAEGVTREVPAPFLVIATQNPSGSSGTQSLPEAQVDRFMVNLSIGYPDFDSELAMAMGITDKSRPGPVREDEKIFIFSPHSFYMVYGGNVSAPISYGSCCGRNNPALPFVFSDQIFEKKFDCRILREQSDIEKRGKDGNKNLDRKFLCFSGGKIQTGVYLGLQKNEKNFFL